LEDGLKWNGTQKHKHQLEIREAGNLERVLDVQLLKMWKLQYLDSLNGGGEEERWMEFLVRYLSKWWCHAWECGIEVGEVSGLR
jgi:hypothetical protein